MVFWQGLGGPEVKNYMVKSASVPEPLAGFRGGANVPDFGKKSNN